MGLFSLSERLHAQALDDVAAFAMRRVAPQAAKRVVHNAWPAPDKSQVAQLAEHWTAAQNSHWKWFECERLVNGKWKLAGITTPINQETGELYTGQIGYLSEELVPDELRFADATTAGTSADYAEDGPHDGQPLAERRGRHGRPPSKWLRSLNAAELHTWLKTITVPEAGVSGMTFMTHLTRDHSFDEANIVDLSEDDLAKLHAAAHYGY